MKLGTLRSTVQATRYKKCAPLLCALLALAAPTSAFAQVIITEIMYDVSGTDSNREWIEIYNEGSDPVDLADWKLFEANTNHGLVFSGSTVLSPGAYAVIVQKPESFASDWPGVSFVIDSAFSLGNGGESLEIRRPDGTTSDSASYASSQGAAGDGNSLQKHGGSWLAAGPTPGGENATEAASASESEETYSTPSNSDDLAKTNIAADPGVFFVDGGSDRSVMAGVDAPFSAESKNHPASSVRFTWNFGNGAVKEGAEVVYRYDFPGEYAVSVTAESGGRRAEDRFTVKVESVSVSVSSVTPDGIVLKNSGKEVDLSGWTLRDGAGVFTLPENTVLLGGKTLTIPRALSGLSGMSVALYLPSGLPAQSTQTGTSASAGSASQASPYAYPTPKTAQVPSSRSQKAATEENGETSQEADIAVSQAAASVLSGASSEENPLFYWILGLVGVLALGGGAVFLLGRGTKSEADSYTIIEQKED